MGSPAETSDTPHELATVPPRIGTGSGEVRAIVSALEAEIRGIKGEISLLNRDRHSDFKFTMSVFAAGVVLLVGMLFFGFFKLDDRTNKVDDSLRKQENLSTRIDTKLEDLLARIPPVQAPAPRR
jgi:hypothetical protein